MKDLRLYRKMVWVLATAYLALLAHAFVPHHHHMDGNTAFVNHKTCPQDAGENDHTHQSYSGDCDTLKHTLLREGHTGEFQPVQLFVFDLTGLSLLGDPVFFELLHLNRTHIARESGQLQTGLSNASGLRGPPSLS